MKLLFADLDRYKYNNILSERCRYNKLESFEFILTA